MKVHFTVAGRLSDMPSLNRRQFLRASAPVATAFAGCQALGSRGSTAKRLVGIEVLNADTTESHTFEVIMIREDDTTDIWKTVTLPPETYRAIPPSWEQTGTFLLTVRVDETQRATARFPAEATMSGVCWKFRPKVTGDGALQIPLAVLGERADAPTPVWTPNLNRTAQEQHHDSPSH